MTRTPPWRHSLEAALTELESTNPDVAAAALRLRNAITDLSQTDYLVLWMLDRWASSLYDPHPGRLVHVSLDEAVQHAEEIRQDGPRDLAWVAVYRYEQVRGYKGSAVPPSVLPIWSWRRDDSSTS